MLSVMEHFKNYYTEEDLLKNIEKEKTVSESDTVIIAKIHKDKGG